MKMVKKALAIVLALTLVVSMAVMAGVTASADTLANVLVWKDGNCWCSDQKVWSFTSDGTLKVAGSTKEVNMFQVGAWESSALTPANAVGATGLQFDFVCNAAQAATGVNGTPSKVDVVLKLEINGTTYACQKAGYAIGGTVQTVKMPYAEFAKDNDPSVKLDASTVGSISNVEFDVVTYSSFWGNKITGHNFEVGAVKAYTEGGAAATTQAPTTEAPTTAAPTTAAGTTAAPGTTVAPSADRFTFKWNQTPKGYWEGGGCSPTVTPDADGAKVEWSGNINGWKDAQVGAYAGVPGKFEGMDGIKFKAYYGDGHNFDKTLTVKISAGGKIYSKAVTLTKENIEHVVLFEGAMTDSKDEITPDVYKDISVIIFSFAKWVGEDTPLKVNAYVGNFTSYKVGDAVETTTPDPDATTEAVDTAAVEKIVELLGELPEDADAKFTYDQYIALESFLEEYATINNATVKYLADEYGITADVYTELLNLYNEMDIPEQGDGNIGDGDENEDNNDNNDNNNAGADDDDNASTGAAAPISILVMAAAAGVVLYKSKKR